MSPAEAETIISFDETGEPAEVYTASARVAGILRRRGLKPYKTTTNNGKENGWYFNVPRSAVALKPGSNMIRLCGRAKMAAMLPD